MEGRASPTWRILGLALAIAALGALFGPSLAEHHERSSAPLLFHDDARQQIFPFHRYAAPDLLRDDPIADYYLSMFPVAYHALYAAAARFWSAPELSQLLPYLLLAVTVIALAAAAGRLGGTAAAFGTAALALSSTAVMRAVGGGLPHSFGFPLLSVGIALLVFGRVRALALWGALSAGFYPIASVILGLSAAIVLLVVPAADRGRARAWSGRRRIVTLAVAAALSVLLVLPPALGSTRWGNLVGPDQFEAWPEAAVGGRYGAALARPWPHFVAWTPQALHQAIDGRGEAFVPRARRWLEAGIQSHRPWDAGPRRRGLILALLAVGGLGWVRLAARDAAARRLAVLPLATLLGHTVSRVLDPAFYLPGRYLGYALPALALALVPAALGGAAAWLPPVARRPWLRAGATLLLSVTLLAAVGGRVQSIAGVSSSARHWAPLLEAVAATPPDALIAGWPNGPIEAIPLVTQRRAFLTYETHQAFHTDYLETMRVRMRALLDAYAATSLEPLLRLRDEHGVTHLLVDLGHFEGRAPGYFRPFYGWSRAAFREAGDRTVLPDLARRHGTTRVGDVILVPLEGLGANERP